MFWAADRLNSDGTFVIDNKIDRTIKPSLFAREISKTEFKESPTQEININEPARETINSSSTYIAICILCCCICLTLLFTFLMITLTITDNFKGPCYDYKRIDYYTDDGHKYCNREQYFNSTFIKLDKKGKKCKGACLRKHWSGKSKKYICDDYVDCAEFNCILSSRIRIDTDGSEKLIKFKECYQNIDKNFFIEE